MNATGRNSLLVIDGAYGEGGGQILRTALALSALLARPVRIERIREGRPKPGLAAQHLTAVRAAAALCDADLQGDALGSTALQFTPKSPPRAGAYRFDVGAAREGGSAGAATLVLQTVVLPLAAAAGRSEVTVVGGTHMKWSPSYDYAADVWLPLLDRMGVSARLELRASGWFPLGKGEILARIDGRGPAAMDGWCPLDVAERGRLVGVRGRALSANLAAHVSERMAARARGRLQQLGAPVEIAAVTTAAACPGAGLFLVAEYENCRCGFSALGERGKPSEFVADEAADGLLSHWRSGAALDRHLADQALLPLALASGPSRFTAEALTPHLESNGWVIERFGIARVRRRRHESGAAMVEIEPLRGDGQGRAPGSGR